MKTNCLKCKADVIFRCGNVICEKCGFEITVDRHFAHLMAEAILGQKADGLDRTEWLERIAVAYVSANTVADDVYVRLSAMVSYIEGGEYRYCEQCQGDYHGN